MSASTQRRVVHLATAVYRALLVAYPIKFRRAYGPQMGQVFKDRCHDVCRHRGTRALLVLWLRTLVDLVATALAERRSAMQDNGWPDLPSAYRPLRWAGVLVLIGGVGESLVPTPSPVVARVVALVVFFIIPLLPLVFTLTLTHKRRFRAAWHGALYAGLQWSIWVLVWGVIGLKSLLEQPSPDNPPGLRIQDWWLLGSVGLEIFAIWCVFHAMHRLRSAEMYGVDRCI